MRADYILKRFGIFLLIVWVAATLNFFLPRLGSAGPDRSDKLMSRPLPAATSSRASQEMVDGVRGEVRPGPAALAAVPDLPGRHRPLRLQLLDRELPAHASSSIMLEALALDHRAARGDDAALVHPRHAARRVAGLAALAEMAALADAAAAGAARGAVLSARLDPDLRVRVHTACCRSTAGYTPGPFRPAAVVVRAATCSATRSCRPSRSSWSRSAAGRWHARDDGHHPGRGLHQLRRGQGPAGQARSSSATRSATRCCRRSRRWRWCSGTSLGRRAGRGGLRLPGHRHGPVPGHSRLDFFLIQGIVFMVIVSIGLADADAGPVYPLLDPRITYQRG